jgi:hypothetical protein
LGALGKKKVNLKAYKIAAEKNRGWKKSPGRENHSWFTANAASELLHEVPPSLQVGNFVALPAMLT